MGIRSNAQGETQMLAEWLTQNARGAQSKTNVPVGKQSLIYRDQVLTPAQRNAFGVWSDKVDARIAWGTEVWLVEAKIVGVSGAYGQILDYTRQYPQSADYQSYLGQRIVPVVLCAFERPETARYFEGFGVRTIVFTPTWAAKTLATKIFGSGVDL